MSTPLIGAAPTTPPRRNPWNEKARAILKQDRIKETDFSSALNAKTTSTAAQVLTPPPQPTRATAQKISVTPPTNVCNESPYYSGYTSTQPSAQTTPQTQALAAQRVRMARAQELLSSRKSTRQHRDGYATE